MTPPDNPERRVSTGTPADTPTTGAADAAAPPWQRVAEDSANGDRWSSGRAAEAATHAEHEQHAGAAEQTVVTGSAASRLFSGAQDTGPTQQIADDGSTGAPPDPASAPPPRREPSSVGGRGRGAPSALRRPGRGPRRANLQVKRFDPWSVLKLSLVLGVALFFIWLVAVGVLYTVLDGMGVWDKLNGTYTSLVEGEGTEAAGDPLISPGRVFSIAAVVGAINIVLLSALATVSAFIYNVCADLAGGLEVTLSERE